MQTNSPTLFAILVMFAGVSWAPRAAHAEDTKTLTEYADVLNFRGVPEAATDRKADEFFRTNVFFDNGAWHGYALQPLPERKLGFVGPLVLTHDGRIWVSDRLAQFEIADRATGRPLDLAAASIQSSALPGRLVQNASVDGIEIHQALVFSDARTALVRMELRSAKARRLGLGVRGGAARGGARYQAQGAEVLAVFPSSPVVIRTALLGAPSTAEIEADGTYRLELTGDLKLAAGETCTVFLMQSAALDPGEATHTPAQPAAQFETNAVRWNGYLERVFHGEPPLLREPRYRRVAVKAIVTLLGNWRSPSGDLHYEGLFPSYSNDQFHGFWAWDSWKHAAALARFAPDLARNQIRALFDYQNDIGMVPDVIYRDKQENNWRDTKPPLAAWAVWEVYSATGDRAFLAEMFPRLMRYHRFWYTDRDHDRDGLAEYGSTDGTRIAAAWESGMDNAVRFDHAKMLRNGEHAWSLDQESVDLNSYLYLEKLRLADMARVLSDAAAERTLRNEALTLRDKIRARMFDAKSGYFYDIGISDGTPVRVLGPEGWMPLWAGVATDRQARAVARIMLDPRHFATPMPFPTLDAARPEFSPEKGYWRGPVWLDQAQFAIEALQNYGMRHEADAMRRRMLDNAVGLLADAPIFENYHPLTGAGVQSPNFSWSAAHYLRLLLH